MLIKQAVADAISRAKLLSAVKEHPNPIDDSLDSYICIGLSGGVDSTVLMHASAQYAAAFNRKIRAIHVHHGLSENADAWAQHAQTLCEQLSAELAITIDCIIEKVQLGHCSDGIEQAARLARYQIFEKHCNHNDVLLQGHHLDDQIETFFMRALRGSGLTGLASIPKQRNLSRTNTCPILRPLLSIEKSQLIDYAKDQQLNWVEDESNQDSALDRNWWRNELLPQIWQRYPKQKQSLSRTISTVQHEQRLLQQLILDEIVAKGTLQSSAYKIHPALKNIPNFDLLLIRKMDQATGLNYVRAWLAQHVDILPSALQMQTLYVDMIQAQPDAEPRFTWSSSILYRYQNRLCLVNAAILNGAVAAFNDWQGQDLKYFNGLLTCEEAIADFALKPGQYRLKNWQAGDVAKPAGRSTRKMKKWWQDYSVPSWAREHWPIIVNKETNEIAAVPGLFVCQDNCVSSGQPGWLVDYKVVLK
ncbi:MAG: tRNA(Ile)-lysidine synthase [Oleispira sp.]